MFTICMQTNQDIAKRIQNLRQARTASFVVCISLLTLGFFEVGIVGRFLFVQATYTGFLAIGAAVIFMMLAGIAKSKLKRILGA